MCSRAPEPAFAGISSSALNGRVGTENRAGGSKEEEVPLREKADGSLSPWHDRHSTSTQAPKNPSDL